MGSLIDIHIHSEFSICSGLMLEEIVARAKAVGLDGICVTDHNCNDIREKADAVSAAEGFPIFTGVEFWTEVGDVIALGVEKRYEFVGEYTVIPLEEIARDNPAAVFILAHPFRLRFEAKLDKFEPLKRLFSAVEGFNANTSHEGNEAACKLAQDNSLGTTGGSDTHKIGKIGHFATAFEEVISCEADLLHALKSGRYHPVSMIASGRI